jgi:hypothetical protein
MCSRQRKTKTASFNFKIGPAYSQLSLGTLPLRLFLGGRNTEFVIIIIIIIIIIHFQIIINQTNKL